ncbi:MAG TPA: NAD-dependent epimerase/dehydratase family protein [Ktedonobacterales bacterium]|nr:NAD-dependent epimerase/dehydratase family protein [Ktedonobacterales bacterium]
MSEHDFHVVLGASGGVGNAVVRELVAQGKRVRGVTRSGKANVPADVEMVAADISNLDQARAVCRDASVAYFCANPAYDRWPQEFPPLLEGAIAGASAAGAKLIAAANLYVYAPPTQPLTEEMPWKPFTRKGKVRAAMDERLLAAHRSGEVQAAIGRASDFFGPGALNSSVLGERFFDALLAGKSVQWIGRVDVVHTHSYIDDFGRGLVTLGTREEALGQSWHIPAAEPLTGHEFLKMVFEEAGMQGKITRVTPTMLRLVGLFNPLAREVLEMAYEFEQPFIMDGAKFTRAFGGAPTAHLEAVRQTVAWFKARQQTRAAAGA